jgi:hypothetical protein
LGRLNGQCLSLDQQQNAEQCGHQSNPKKFLGV